MTMKWTVGYGVVLAAMAVSAMAARDEGKEESRESPAVPTVKYVVASPRAYLTSAATQGAIDYSVMTGAAENFVRPARGRVRIVEVPVGTRVVFALSPETEGVWMPGAHGLIGTRLTLQWFGAEDCAECDAGAAADANGVTLPDSARAGTRTDVSQPVPALRWLTLATDGARDTRMGPSIGSRLEVAVPVRFVKTGVFCLRGIINTSVRSWSPAAAGQGRDRAADEERSDTTAWPDNLLARDVDVVYVAVRVVEKSDTGRGAAEEDDPDVTHTSEIPRITEVEAIDLEDDDLGDLGVLASQQEGDFVLPIEDEDIGN